MSIFGCRRLDDGGFELDPSDGSHSIAFVFDKANPQTAVPFRGSDKFRMVGDEGCPGLAAQAPDRCGGFAALRRVLAKTLARFAQLATLRVRIPL